MLTLLFSYCATKGLLWSHMGWIFFKPKYERMALIERDDLENDPGEPFHVSKFLILLQRHL